MCANRYACLLALVKIPRLYPTLSLSSLLVVERELHTIRSANIPAGGARRALRERSTLAATTVAATINNTAPHEKAHSGYIPVHVTAVSQ